MIDLATASSDELIAAAKQTLLDLKNNKHLSTAAALDLTEWLYAYGLQLIRVSSGIPVRSEEEIDEEIKKLAESV